MFRRRVCSNRHTHWVVIIAFVLLVSCLSGATRYPLRVKDSRGKSIVIPHEPKRIVSLAPSNTEILFALGLGSRVVGVTRFCNYPPEAKKKTIVGDANISVEKVIALKPDLVLAHETLNDTAVRALEARRVRVVTVNSKTIDQVIRDMLLVGRITNKEREASKVAKRISSARSLVRQKVSGISKKPKVLVAIQANPLWVAGPSTFVNEMIVDAGGVNIASNAKPGFTQFSAEIAVAKKPDVIIATTKGDKQVFTRGVWKRTPAVHNGCVYEVNADLIVRPGPRLADGIMLIARLLHPDVFKKR